MKVNANRHYNPDPLEDVALKLPGSLRQAIDAMRGKETRTAWIKRACEELLKAEEREKAWLADTWVRTVNNANAN